MEEKIKTLFKQYSGSDARRVEPLAVSGSARRYYRVFTGDRTYVGVYHENLRENRLFVDFTRHFEKSRLHVPHVYCVSEDGFCYLQDDLGPDMLLDVVEREREVEFLSEHTMELYRKALSELLKFQLEGGKGLDYSGCLPRPVFDERCIRWDLNYFKYCFLKTTGLDFNEVKLEKAFSEMAKDLVGDPDKHAFQYRDFQARNVMLDRDGQPRFIDFQGGRRGPVEYDVASFLWQASAHYAPELRHELMAVYLDAARLYTGVDEGRFRERMRLFVLFRTLQVLGAYGFRGYFERKKHFLDSIAPAIRNLREWLSEGECPYPYLYDVLSRMVELPAFRTEVSARPDEPCGKDTGMERAADVLRADIGPASFSRYDGRGALVVRVFSFSYKKGIPEDTSGNGGGYVFDCRSTHNPGRYEPYKALTGLDEPVIRFLEEDGEILTFLDSVYKLADAHVARYLRRGFTDLMFAFGCTGGRHRSVYSAQHLAEHLHAKFGIEVRICHREQNIERILPPTEL